MKLIYIFNDQLNLEVSSLHNVIKDEDIIVLTETFERGYLRAQMKFRDKPGVFYPYFLHGSHNLKKCV